MVIVDNPTKFADKFKLNSPRLKNWDYSTPGYYFVTICTCNHNNFFGKIINNKMELSKMGIISNRCLIDIPRHFSNVILDEYIVMPNHVHILIKIINNKVETPYMASLQTQQTSLQTENKYKKLNKKSNQLIPKAIQQFKSAVTRQINPKKIFFGWQSRFHDEIIRNEKEYLIIKQYIQNNIQNWNKDKYFSIS